MYAVAAMNEFPALRKQRSWAATITKQNG